MSWKSKKQNTVSRSSAESEYRAMAAATSEMVWLQQLLRDLKVSCSSSPVLYCDNQAAMHIASNPSFHERTKHIEVDLYFVRDHLNRGDLKLLPVRTHHQLADAFTKPLPSSTLATIISKLSVKNLYLPT